MKAKPEITIVPVFDQSKGDVWSEFTRIEMLCDKITCGYKVGAKDKKRIYDQHVFEWKYEPYNFAFAAYDGDKMVGFASGYRETRQDMYLHNLYVEPEYNGLGIGKNLLAQSERAAALVTDNMTLMSLSGALKFYEHCGYGIHDRRNCEKGLSKEIIGVVPVFKSTGWLRVKNKTDFDKSFFARYKYAPVFAYVSLGREMDAIAARTPDGEIQMWANEKKRGMKDFYEKQLLRALVKVR